MNDSLYSSSDFFYTGSWQQRAEEFNKAVTWLSSLGLNIASTRIAKYRKDLLILAEAYRQKTVDQLLKKRNFASLVNSLNESDELIIIWRGLKQLTDQNFVERLKKFIKGPEHSTDEHLPSSSHTARDIEFELYTAAHFSSAGFNVDFGSDADLRIREDSKPTFIECKRPRTISSVKKNIQEAFRQLTNRYNSTGLFGNVYGKVVFSISKIVNPEHKLLVVKSDSHLVSALYSVMEEFFTKFKHLWQSQLDIRTIGILFHLRMGAITQHNNLFRTCHRFGANNTALYGSSACNKFTEIVKRLDQSHSFLLKS